MKMTFQVEANPATQQDQDRLNLLGEMLLVLGTHVDSMHEKLSDARGIYPHGESVYVGESPDKKDKATIKITWTSEAIRPS